MILQPQNLYSRATVAVVRTFEWRHLLGNDDDDDDECPPRRLINNLADISDKAIPAKRRDRKNGHHSNTMEVFMKKGEEKTMKVMKEYCAKGKVQKMCFTLGPGRSAEKLYFTFFFPIAIPDRNPCPWHPQRIAWCWWLWHNWPVLMHTLGSRRLEAEAPGECYGESPLISWFFCRYIKEIFPSIMNLKIPLCGSLYHYNNFGPHANTYLCLYLGLSTNRRWLNKQTSVLPKSKTNKQAKLVAAVILAILSRRYESSCFV